jgi:TonB-dependent starch-binding outer membrane protein SusC
VAFTGLGTNVDAVTLVPAAAAPNPRLRWETQDQFNAGLDLAFLQNRVSLTLDAYQSETSNLLLSVNLPWTSGYNTQLQNVGAVRNRGVEASLSTLNLDTDRFSWETTLNLSANRNKVTQLYGGLQSLGAGSSTQVGQPLGTFVGHEVLGIFREGDQCNITNPQSWECRPGEYIVRDVNGDGVINNDDRVNLGNPQADYYGGLSSNMRYGPVSLDAFFNFSVGNMVNNQAMRFMGLVGGASNERADRALARWTPTNQNTNVPRANLSRPNNRTYSTYVEDASFLRLQTISLGYELPSTRIPAVNSARLIVSGDNVWITTRYSGWDPEVGSGGFDGGGYPQARSWNVGMNVTF